MRRLHIAGAALPLVLILAACGGGATPTPSIASPSTPAASPSAAASDGASASPTASPTGSDSASSDYPLKVASGASGSYLTGKDGLALYVFANDTKDSGKSVCNGDCATNWPAYEADEVDEVEADSAATGKLSIVTRDDGSKQLAYNGQPLYYFAGDQAAGDTNGASIPKWSLATP